MRNEVSVTFRPPAIASLEEFVGEAGIYALTKRPRNKARGKARTSMEGR